MGTSAQLAEELSLSQLGPDFLLVHSPADHLPPRATIELQVDDWQRTWEVDRPKGMKAGDAWVTLANVG
ncbi:MAG TPA: hypothetical protein PLX89_13365 [Verrucomicrobiota bacterium]|nr:hypothetical protein [Verrucomicrobiales bacterium]HRI13981.1 hypothetical protein [Verrucomicrobiota bacterium]